LIFGKLIISFLRLNWQFSTNNHALVLLEVR
jgi:hypothetical protein